MPRMGRWISARWSPDAGAGHSLPRMTPISYQAYVPDPIGRLELLFPSSLVQAMSQAEAALARLEHRVATIGYPTLRQLTMVDALGSGRLSGLTTSSRRLAEVLGGHNRRDAMAQQVAQIARASEVAMA